MKKLNLIYGVLIGLLIFTSCSSDDSDSENGTDVSIVGTWNGVSSSFNGNNSGVPDNNIVKFMSDNRTEFIYEGFANSGQDITETGSWSKSGNSLIITFDDADPGNEIYILNIIELTETNLEWETNISGEGTLVERFER